ncbi:MULTISPECIES: hypothetical protein [Methylococcus]|uniref:Uncharacterized protein n=1 Tax=Methylococcus capsulatus TaxID=414 RepID=A0ABZ2F9B5_METCP|nr:MULTISPECIES: hypothetical protein [Methylococcus]MDF9393012.1 hypothetical protein [Methylococcus capsulatus]
MSADTFHETTNQVINRVTAWTLAAVELLEIADRHPEQPGARDPERLRVIADTLADVSAELRNLVVEGGAA